MFEYPANRAYHIDYSRDWPLYIKHIAPSSYNTHMQAAPPAYKDIHVFDGALWWHVEFIALGLTHQSSKARLSHIL